MRVLLGQLNSNGDCLYATILARQIKADYPECELTWAISSQCRHILIGNPHVDHIWEIQAAALSDREMSWWGFAEAVLRIQTGPEPFDRVILSQIWPANFRNYDGTIRASMLRAYAGTITVPIESVIVLQAHEIQRVERYIDQCGIRRYTHRILFECSSTSGQSYVTPDFAIEVAERICSELADCCFIISTHEPIAPTNPRIFSAREIGMRENAHLTHACTLFVGCGSGLTVVATSTAAKTLPTIQLLSSRTSMYASFCHDFEFFNKSTERFIEMGDAAAETVVSAIIACCREGLVAARATYHKPLPLIFDFYLELIDQWLVQRGHYFDALESLSVTADRYGWRDELIGFAKERVIPSMHLDKMNCDLQSKSRAETLVGLIP